MLGKICPACKKLVPSLGLKSVSESICTYYYYHKKQSYLSFRFTIFFGYLTKFYNYYNSKGAIYLNNNTIKWINCDLSFFLPNLWSYCFSSSPLPFSSCLLLLCGEWNLNFERSYFFWAGFGTCHEGSGTKSYNLVLFWPLCPFCLPSAAIGQRSSQLWLTLFALLIPTQFMFRSFLADYLPAMVDADQNFTSSMLMSLNRFSNWL